jgi:comEA protein
MTTKQNSGLRRVTSLAAFTALIAAVTIAFAEAPDTRRSMTLTEARPSLSTGPLVPTLLLAEAPVKLSKSRVSKKAKSSKKATLTGTLNINIASAAELVKLPGIGPKKATLIVRWRKNHGKFGRVVDLRRVKGFGKKSVQKLLPYLSVSGKSTLR